MKTDYLRARMDLAYLTYRNAERAELREYYRRRSKAQVTRKRAGESLGAMLWWGRIIEGGTAAKAVRS